MKGRFATLSACLRHYAGVAPSRIAVASGARCLSFAELDRQVDLCASMLLARGVRPGDRVAFCGSPRIAFWTTLLATLRIGATWLGLNPRHQWPELHHVLGDAEPRILFQESDAQIDLTRGDLLHEAALDWIHTIPVHADDSGNEPWLADDAAESLLAAVRQAEATVQSGHAAVLVYTSGSSGKPKGALLSQASLSWGAEIQTRQLAVEDPRIVCNLPISHVGCIADICATTLIKGGYIRFQDKFEPTAWLNAIARDQLTIWAGVPTMFIHALEVLRPQTDLSSLQLILWGGATMPGDTIKQLRRHAPRLKTAYGLTETACHVAFTRDFAADATLAETVGVPVPEIPLRIVAAAGACAADEPGEIQVGGGLNFIGYWRNPQASAAAFTPDGWLRTGDVGAWTAAGDLRLVGRLHDQFKSGGYNVYPREIEAALEAHAAVALAAVVAIPDPRFQEVGCAFVQLKPAQRSDAAQLRAHLRTQLANYKIPKALYIVDALPLLPIGKVDKGQLRAVAAARAAAAVVEASR